MKIVHHRSAIYHYGRPISGRSTLFIFFISIIFSSAICGFFWYMNFPSIPILIEFWFSIFIMSFIAGYGMFSKQSSIFLLVFAFYHLFILIIPGMSHITLGHFPFYHKSYPIRDIGKASAIILLFSCATFLGMVLSVKRTNAPRVNERAIYRYSIKKILISLTVLAFAVLLSANILGFHNLMSRRGDVGINNLDVAASQNQVLVALARLGSYALLITVVSLLIRRRDLRIAIAAILSFVLFVMLNLPTAIPRFYLFGYLLGFIYLFFDMNNRGNRIFLFLSMSVSLLFIFPAASIISRGDIRQIDNFNPLLYYESSGDFDSMQSTINVVRLVAISGPQYGHQLMGTLLAFVPRAVWLSKPEPTGAMAGRANGYAYLNLSAPLLSEYYVDFSYIGVIVLGFLTGYWATWLDRKAFYARRDRDLLMPLLFAVAIGFEVIVLRGTLMAAITPVGLLFLIVLAIQRFSRIEQMKCSLGG